MPVSFPLLLSQSPPCFKSFLTWGCIGPIISFFLPFWLIFLLILGEILWIDHKNPFHLVKNLIKHPAHPNLIKSTVVPPSSSIFCLYFTHKTECIAKKTICFCFFFISQFLAITNHRAHSPLEIVFPWIRAHSILHPIFNSPHPFLRTTAPPLFSSLLSNEVLWNSLHKVGSRHEDRDGAYDVENAEGHQTQAVDYGACKFPLVGHALGLVLLPETVCHVTHLLQDSLQLGVS